MAKVRQPIKKYIAKSYMCFTLGQYCCPFNEKSNGTKMVPKPSYLPMAYRLVCRCDNNNNSN